MQVIRSKDFTAPRAWGSQLIANMQGITTKLHWTNQPYRWHVNDGEEVFVVLDGTVDMHYRYNGIEETAELGAGDLLFPDAIALGVTIFWTLGMQNSMNFIDGLDGLSGGISLFAAVTLGVIALPTSPLLAALSFTLAGALAGFLRFNFYPASIYMGTSGILAVAYALAVLALLGTAKVAAALLILGVPIIDALFVIVGRIVAGRSPYTPDESHIHRRLLSYGFSHRGSVLVLYALTAALSILALLLTGSATLYAFMGLLVVLGGVGQLAGTVYAALGLGILNKFLEGWVGAVLAKIAVLVFIIIFIQKRPQGIFALKGRQA